MTDDFQSAKSRLQSITRQIMTTALPIMKAVKDDDCDLIDQLMTKKEMTRQEACVKIRAVILSIIEDARRVASELPGFTVPIDDSAVPGTENLQFLQQVWYGDVYGVAEIEGLNALCADMEKQLQNLSPENILSAVSV